MFVLPEDTAVARGDRYQFIELGTGKVDRFVTALGIAGNAPLGIGALTVLVLPQRGEQPRRVLRCLAPEDLAVFGIQGRQIGPKSKQIDAAILHADGAGINGLLLVIVP